MLIYKDKNYDDICIVLDSHVDKDFAFSLNATFISSKIAKVPLTINNVEKLVKLLKIKGISAKVDPKIFVCVANLKNKMEEEETALELKRVKKLKILRAEKVLIDKADLIKTKVLNKDTFSTYVGYCQGLMPHQKAGSLISDIFNKYAFFYDTGTGKTVTALEIMIKKQKNEQAKFLIICPKTIISTAWLEDCEKYFPSMKLLPLSKNITIEQYNKIYDRWNTIDCFIPPPNLNIFRYSWESGKSAERLCLIQKRMVRKAEHFIVNPELFVRNFEYFMSLNVNGLIVDESAKLKNINTEISRLIGKFSQKMKYTYLLSGKPAPNSSLEYYSQLKIVDKNRFNMSYYSFGKEYFDLGGSSEKLNQLATIINRKSFTLSKEECLDLPKRSYTVRKVKLNNITRQKYNSMCYQLYIQYLEDEKANKSIAVVNGLAAAMKLRQIASGFIIDENKKVHQLHRTKLLELIDVIDELGNNQAIIWCQFKYEVIIIERMLTELGKKVVTAYSGTKNKDESIIKFKTGEAEFIIAHPRTLMYGVTLTNCTYAIYYSTSYSHEEYYQSHDRIYRKGQTNPCTYIFLQVENTIDETMYEVIQNKKSNSDFIEMIIKNIVKMGLDKQENCFESELASEESHTDKLYL